MQTEKIIYKKELNDYKGKEVLFTSQNYFDCQLPFEFCGHKVMLTADNENIDIPNFINNLIILNPNKNKETIFNVVNDKIKKLYFKPISQLKLINLIDKYFMNKENLKPVNEKNKEMWINPTCTNKMEVYQNSRKQKTTDIINDFFNNELIKSTEKITIDKIAFITGLAVRTLKNHLTDEQKKQIKEFNLKLKSAMTMPESAFIKIEPIINNMTESFDKLTDQTKEVINSINDFKSEVEPADTKESLIEKFEDYLLTYNNYKFELTDDCYNSIPEYFNNAEIKILYDSVSIMPKIHKMLTKRDRVKKVLKEHLIYTSAISKQPATTF